CARVTTGFDVW
nr:immunoglobulin heavy chain junction region [Mus musculus]